MRLLTTLRSNDLFNVWMFSCKLVKGDKTKWKLDAKTARQLSWSDWKEDPE